MLDISWLIVLKALEKSKLSDIVVWLCFYLILVFIFEYHISCDIACDVENVGLKQY